MPLLRACCGPHTLTSFHTGESNLSCVAYGISPPASGLPVFWVRRVWLIFEVLERLQWYAVKHWYKECLQQAKQDAAPITGSTESRRVFQDHQYNTCCYTRCPCKYRYEGTGGHKVLMYNDIEGAKVPRMLAQYMQSELSLQRVNILDCLVLNL